MNQKCAICGGQKWEAAYTGAVRQGVFGKSAQGTVWKCLSCASEFLPPKAADTGAFYSGNAYREEVGESADVDAYFKMHDAEQFQKFALLEQLGIRGKVFADIGCGGGSFLDGVRGFASSTVAIEPGQSYHPSLRARGHHVFPFTKDALSAWRGKVDVATCFSVIEHLDDPVSTLKEMRELLSKDGVLLISTPNRRDILMQLSDDYKAFFYRSVHIWYFDTDSLARAAKEAGFRDCSVRFVHRFNFANFTTWLRDKKPTGNKLTTPLSPDFDRQWQVTLENNGTADYLYAYLRP
jgi:SAM-dependent methyltransferase